MRPLAPILTMLLLSAAGCAIAPPPPEPDPIQGATREAGQLRLPDPVLAAACISHGVPASIVELRRSGAAVRPAPGRPDFAVVLDRPQDGRVDYRVLVGEAGPEASGLAWGLGRALADCAARLGGMT